MKAEKVYWIDVWCYICVIVVFATPLITKKRNLKCFHQFQFMSPRCLMLLFSLLLICDLILLLLLFAVTHYQIYVVLAEWYCKCQGADKNTRNILGWVLLSALSICFLFSAHSIRFFLLCNSTWEKLVLMCFWKYIILVNEKHLAKYPTVRCVQTMKW